ncbi:Abi family protein [[Mycoplasma] testudinis]|uniref:Abi family protein n=1 Tax=[Mycoplasma] testudinis TaxID=33924 RepID=UPI0004837311|nr:Abi family protein [[Mycoplasma] testudinis]
MNTLKVYTSAVQQLNRLEAFYQLKMNTVQKNKIELYLNSYGYERVVSSAKPLIFDYEKNIFKPEFNGQDLCKIFDIDRNISSTISRYLLKSAEIQFNTLVANQIAQLLFEANIETHGLIGAVKDKDLEKIFDQHKKVYKVFKKQKNNKNLIIPAIWQLKRDLISRPVSKEKYNKTIEEYKKEITKCPEIATIINDYINKRPNDEAVENCWLPIWILATNWTFDRTIAIYHCLSPKVQYQIAKKFISNPKWLIDNDFDNTFNNSFDLFLDWMKTVRNIIAHNDQIYNFSYNLQEVQNDVLKLEKTRDFLSQVVKIEPKSGFKYGLISFVKFLEGCLNIPPKQIVKEIKQLFQKETISERLKLLMQDTINW